MYWMNGVSVQELREFQIVGAAAGTENKISARNL